MRIALIILTITTSLLSLGLLYDIMQPIPDSGLTAWEDTELSYARVFKPLKIRIFQIMLSITLILIIILTFSLLRNRKKDQVKKNKRETHMKGIWIILLTFLSLNLSYSQDCNDYIQKFYQENIKGKIKDSIAFCDGVMEAKDYPRLAIRSVGQSNHLTSCEHYAYLKYGVHLELTGDIIYDQSIFDHNNGFNQIMYAKIKDSIPQYFDSIGIVSKSWFSFDVNRMKEFLSFFDLSEFSDSTALVKLDSSKVTNSTFKTLEGIKISDPIGKRNYSIAELETGVSFELTGLTTKNGYFEIDFSAYVNPNNVCTYGTDDKYRIPFRFGP